MLSGRRVICVDLFSSSSCCLLFRCVVSLAHCCLVFVLHTRNRAGQRCQGPCEVLGEGVDGPYVGIRRGDEGDDEGDLVYVDDDVVFVEVGDGLVLPEP